MGAVIIGVLLVIFVLGFGPGARGAAAGFAAFEQPTKPETAEEHARANSDMLRLLVLLAITFGVLFVATMGGK